MNEFSSLIIGASYGLVVFAITVGWMKYKKRTKDQRKKTDQGYLFNERGYSSSPNKKDDREIVGISVGRGV